MSDVERLGNVGRGVLDNDFLSLPRIALSVLAVPIRKVEGEIVDLGKDLVDHVGRVELEMQKGFVMGDRFDPIIGLELQPHGKNCFRYSNCQVSMSHLHPPKPFQPTRRPYQAA